MGDNRMRIRTSEVFQLELYILVIIVFSRPYTVVLRRLTLALSNLVDLLIYIWFYYVYCVILRLIIDKETMASYSSMMLKSIGKIPKAVTNYHLFSLNNTIRIKIISLGIRKRWNNEPYRRSKGGGGSFFHKINTIVGQHNDWRHLNICSSKTPSSIDYRNILTVQPIDTKIKSMCEFQTHCALINCRSVVNKSMELQVELVQNRIDICSLTDTWIRDDDTAAEAQMCPPGYKTISVPRSNRQGGGIAIVYRDCITIQRSNTYDYTTMECSDFALSLPGLSLNMAVIYRPPDKLVCSFVSDFLDYVERNIKSTGKLLLTGDFNIHVNDPESPDANTFLDVLGRFGL